MKSNIASVTVFVLPVTAVRDKHNLGGEQNLTEYFSLARI